MEVNYLLRSPGARVGVGPERLKPLAAHGVGCPDAGLNLEIRQLFCYYIDELLLNVTLNHNQPIATNEHSMSEVISTAVAIYREKTFSSKYQNVVLDRNYRTTWNTTTRIEYVIQIETSTKMYTPFLIGLN